jgi:ribosomal protein S14
MRACPGRPVRLGRGYAEGETCGRPGRYQIGTLRLCKMCFRAVVRDAEAHAHAGAEHGVLLSACVFPASSPDRVSAPLCAEPAVADVAGAPACSHHYARALAWHQGILDRDREAALQLEIEADRQREQEMGKWHAQGSQIIYYLRRADGAVKIGTSTEFVNRFGNLCREHGELEILLTHCGGYPRERETHKRFADLALGGEWFRAGEPLLSWIVQARRRRANMNTKIPGTEPLWYVRQLLREAQEPDTATAA